ncbi:MAG: DUF3618 domain-containing protein [Deltaproteobacteria bacterium]|nr:DUF3618 domain-containing protein [Deltaproteobacteria bacterium]
MPDGESKVQARDPAAIQADIARARDEIARSVLALRERVNVATDWREWFRRRPWVAMGLAFSAGVWLGYRSGAA